MSLRLILGRSGSGKSYFAVSDLLKKAEKDPWRHYYYIVPEQSTMDAQKLLCHMSETGVITNAEALSFDRLARRVFSEVNADTGEVLGEDGKNLILTMVAEKLKGSLHSAGRNIHKKGYVSAIRSLVSEFTQYGIEPDDVLNFGSIGNATQEFRDRISDISLIYSSFLDALEGKYYTAEQIPELFIRFMDRSSIISGSVFVFDGFTGFTPLQYEVIRKILRKASSVDVTVTIDSDADLDEEPDDSDLFCMSREMIRNLYDIGEEEHTDISDPIRISGVKRTSPDSALGFLSANIFRDKPVYYVRDDGIKIVRLHDPRTELRYVASLIKRLVSSGKRYKDIGIAATNLDAYSIYAPYIFSEYDIPLFIDKRLTPDWHPLVLFVRAYADVLLSDFSVRSVMAFLRTGIELVPKNDADRLELYLMSTGIRGKKAYKEDFHIKPRGFDDDHIKSVNSVRNKIWKLFEPNIIENPESDHKVSDMVSSINGIIADSGALDMPDQMLQDEFFHDEGRKKIFRDVFQKYMDLLDKTKMLIGDESMSLSDLIETVDAGIETWKMGSVPYSDDMVILGDLTRSRIGNVKDLIIIGACDSYLPIDQSRAGLISDFERQELIRNGFFIAPDARKKTFQEKFYLYLSLSKPSEELFITFPERLEDGSNVQPAYLVRDILNIIKPLKIDETPANMAVPVTEKEAERYLGVMLRGMADDPSGITEENCLKRAAGLASYFRKYDKEKLDLILKTVFYCHKDEDLKKNTIDELLSGDRKGSISKIEEYESCPYRYFLKYLLGIRETDTSDFGSIDKGIIFHRILELYSKEACRGGRTFNDIKPEDSEAILKKSIDKAYLEYRSAISEPEWNTIFSLEQMKTSIGYDIDFIRAGYDLGHGFVPESFEMSLLKTYGAIDALKFELPDGRSLLFDGKIDRVDRMSKDDIDYMRIIDYKSTGTAILDPSLIRGGIQLQLLFYMYAVISGESEKSGKNILPGEAAYFHLMFSDSDAGNKIKDEDIKNALLKPVSSDGLMLSDGSVEEAIDSESEKRSPLFPKNDFILEKDNFLELMSDTRDTIKTAVSDIYGGKIAMTPYRYKGIQNETPCKKCAYRSACSFDPSIPGYKYRKIEKRPLFSEEGEE
jgi:ATP-dependent helicase/nuclease subunit B